MDDVRNVPQAWTDWTGTADAIDRTVARRLRQRRKKLGLTLQDVAADLNIAYQRVQRWEQGLTRIPSGWLFLHARALGLTPDQLYDGLNRPRDADGLDADTLALARKLNSLPDALKSSITQLIRSF
ncbi:MAG: helix-turn-helix domain-containing protein [Rhodothalassiaceae bacterium]